ncbi:STN1 [Mytilus edulis]|uniref:STN1 n=1 Tax=Mytilus edulis TaxID=6550 RepID=A0A8S3SQ93_MYTED|nr:STN1 [Mytilus edulis]
MTNPSFVNRVETLPPIGASDHDIVYSEINLTLPQNKQQAHKVLHYKKANWEQIEKDLTETYKELKQDQDKLNLDELWNTFKTNIQKSITKNIPTKSIVAGNFHTGTSIVKMLRNDMCKLPVELQSKFKCLDTNATEEFSGYTLGSVIQIRGKISIFRDKRQIVAASHQIVSDPMLEVFRMMELPKLYQMKYDKPFELPWKVAKKLMSKADENDLNTNDMKEVKTTLYGYLQSSEIKEITANVALNLESLEAIRNRLDSKILRKCVEEVLISLEDDGFLCRRIDNDKVFEVLHKDCDLIKAILHILKEECSKEKYMDKGCHYLHVIEMLNRTYQYSHVKKQCVMYGLDKLELQSDIIRSTKCHYLPINYY